MIYFLEDDPSIRKLVIYTLNSQGMEAEGFELPSQFWAAMERQLPSLVLLDLMLPEEDGLHILKRIRAGASTARLPVILITAKGTEYDKVVGLDGGADDYIAKPFDPAELVARVKAHLSRYDRLVGAGRAQDVERITVGELTILPRSWKVYKGERELRLPNREFELLKFLAENPNIVFSKEQLFEAIWGYDYLGDSATVTVHIGRIRDKIEDDPSNPRIIETVWGAGYRLNRP